MASSSEFETDCSQQTECPLTLDTYNQLKEQFQLDSQELFDLCGSSGEIKTSESFGAVEISESSGAIETSESSGEFKPKCLKSVKNKTLSSSSSNTQVNNSYKGRYNFNFNFVVEEEPPTKCCTLTYSKLLNKLFVRTDQFVILPFSVISLPKKIKLQSFLMYKGKNNIVERCPNHLQKEENLANRHHVLQVNSLTDAVYLKDEMGYKVVSVPRIYDSTSFSETYKFGCSSQCRWGIDRSPIIIVCQLVFKDTIVGSEIIEVNVSQCPGRDRMNAEKKYKKSLTAITLPVDSVKQSMTYESSTTVFKETEFEFKNKTVQSVQPVNATERQKNQYKLTVRGRLKAAKLAAISAILTEHPELF
ncbi:cellular tumor antigen p53 isoform X1 [Hydra vulgaris]|uniref:cellular tumor antigen p53 isoform X1 n=1 Tax=Hydra vulgaris TaxID=6087 RepID=UPI0006410BED|nr:cellular tumor antigen p53 [Hydra vulgaris]